MKKRKGFNNFINKSIHKTIDLKSVVVYSVVIIFFFIATLLTGNLNIKSLGIMGIMLIFLVVSMMRYIKNANNPIARRNYEEFMESIEDDFDYDKDYSVENDEERIYEDDEREFDDD